MPILKQTIESLPKISYNFDEIKKNIDWQKV